MSSIVAGANQERMNRWLLIGAAVLAILAGVLIFVAVANTVGDDDGASSKSGDAQSLVARNSIKAGTKLDENMFRVATFAEEDVAEGAVTDPKAVIGQVLRTDLVKGQQLSRSQIGQETDDERNEQLAFQLPEGMRGMAIEVREASIVGGFLVPGDYVDVIVTIRERDSNNSDQDFIRVETVLQNILVMGVAQKPVENVIVVDEEGKPVAPDATNPDLERRPDDAEAKASARTVTLALTPQDVQNLVLADELGDITLAMRRFGENTPQPIERIRIPVFTN